MLIPIFGYVLEGALRDECTAGLADRKVRSTQLVPLLTLTHVCRRWRDLMLGLPAFWTRVDGRNRELFKAFVKRSSPKPLSLSLVAPCRQSRRLASIAPRLRRLDLLTTAVLDIPTLLSIDAPNIQCLTIVEQVARRVGFQPLNVYDPIIFNRRTSSLRALAMDFVNWLPGNHFPHLTHLYFNFRSRAVIPSNQLLSLFANMPQLAYLTLCGLKYTEGATIHPAMAVRTAALPSLRCARFTTSCDWMAIASLVLSLTTPASAFFCVINPVFDEDDATPWLARMQLDGLTHMEICEEHYNSSTQIIAVGPLGQGVMLLTLPKYCDRIKDMIPSIKEITTLTVAFGNHAHGIRVVLKSLEKLVELRMYLADATASVAEPSIRHISSTLTAQVAGVAGNHVSCPELRVLSIDIGTSFFDPTDLVTMVISRARNAHLPLSQFIVESAVSDRNQRAVMFNQFQCCKDYVGEYIFREPDPARPLCMSIKPAWWDEEEKYWDLPDSRKPEYRCY